MAHRAHGDQIVLFVAAAAGVMYEVMEFDASRPGAAVRSDRFRAFAVESEKALIAANS
jgi:hypothetical protein